MSQPAVPIFLLNTLRARGGIKRPFHLLGALSGLHPASESRFRHSSGRMSATEGPPDFPAVPSPAFPRFRACVRRGAVSCSAGSRMLSDGGKSPIPLPESLSGSNGLILALFGMLKLRGRDISGSAVRRKPVKNEFMIRYLIACGMLFLAFRAAPLAAQNGGVELSYEQSLQMLGEGNRSLQLADKAVELARNEQQRMNALWYPTVSATGAYVYLSNPVEVKEPLSTFTDPAKDFVHSIIPDDQIISSILDKIGSYTLHFPLAPRNLTTIDAGILWPVFAGGKRIYAGRIGKTMVSIAETNRGQVGADMQVLLVESYFGLRLGERVVDVRAETFRSLEMHYRDALKLEATGLINKAERLFVQVNMDEAKRELESATKDLEVAQNALRTLIGMDSAQEIRPVTSLFINDTLPGAPYFKSLVGENNYVVRGLRLQDEIADNQLKIGRAGYVPDIALFGKQTLYSHGIQKNLMPRSMVGVGFTWNLFDGLDREKKIRQAKLTKQTIELGRRKAVEDLAVGIDKFYTQMQNALGNVRALNTTIEMSRELVRMRRKAFAEGMATSTEVVDAEVMLSKVQIASLLAYYQYDLALMNLLAVCGIPGEFPRYGEAGRSEHYIFEP